MFSFEISDYAMAGIIENTIGKKKFPVTMLLRAIGFSTNEEIIDLFGLSQVVKIKPDKNEKLLETVLAGDVVD